MPWHMRTTLELPDRLFNQAKKLARRRKVPFRAIVAEALRSFLGRAEKKAPFKLADGSFKGDGLVSGLAETDWEHIRELADEK
jgi:predicted transcriptional regulator